MTKKRFRKRNLDALPKATSKRLRCRKPARKDHLRLGQGDPPKRRLQHVRQRSMCRGNDSGRGLIAGGGQANHSGRQSGQMTGAEPLSVDSGGKTTRVVDLQVLQNGFRQRSWGQPPIELLHGSTQRTKRNPVGTTRIPGKRAFPTRNDLAAFAVSHVARTASARNENRAGLSEQASGQRYVQIMVDLMVQRQRQFGGHPRDAGLFVFRNQARNTENGPTDRSAQDPRLRERSGDCQVDSRARSLQSARERIG